MVGSGFSSFPLFNFPLVFSDLLRISRVFRLSLLRMRARKYLSSAGKKSYQARGVARGRWCQSAVAIGNVEYIGQPGGFVTLLTRYP
jgi:hypothetical protein